MRDLFDRMRQDKGPLGKWADIAEGYFAFPKLEGPISNRMNFNGKEVITWSVNDYLGLANDPEVRRVDTEAAAKYGSAYPMGARLMSGHTDLHEKLQNQLAEFVNKEAAYVLNFGYQGILSTIDSLVSKNDVIVYDIDSHACIIDGVRLHLGKRFTYQHNDMESLEKNLNRATKIAEETNGGILVISEGVFGMRGEQGKLKEIVELKKKFKFRLLVDDAHGFGTLGKTGAGAGEEQGVQDEIDVYFATFAKSLASTGAFIASDKEIIDFLKYNMRSQMFAKSLQSLLVITIILLLKQFLENNDFKVSDVENTNQAKKIMETLIFDLLVIDIMMPGQNGLEFLKEIRQTNSIPSLMLTAMSSPEDRLDGLEYGADDYMTKPFEPRELLLRIQNILKRLTKRI